MSQHGEYTLQSIMRRDASDIPILPASFPDYDVVLAAGELSAVSLPIHIFGSHRASFHCVPRAQHGVIGG